MKVKISELETLGRKALAKYGYSPEESESILQVLMYAQLRGNNQGLVKLIGSGIPRPTSTGDIEVEKETKLSAVLHAHNHHSMIAVNIAVDKAIEKVKNNGMAMIGVHHTNTSSGAVGYYAKKLAEAGLVGFVFAGSPETVATEGSYEPIFGTNPFAISIPTDATPLVLDMATAAMAFYGVIEAHTAGKLLPDDIGYDKDGNLTNIPAKIMDDGALRPFDKGHKGAGLSMLVQILTGPLVGASFTGIGDVASNWGHFILAFDPNELGGLEQLRHGVTQMIEKVKSTKKLPGVTEILVPSERGDKITDAALSSGEIEIEENLFKELQKVAA